MQLPTELQSCDIDGITMDLGGEGGRVGRFWQLYRRLSPVKMTRLEVPEESF